MKLRIDGEIRRGRSIDVRDVDLDPVDLVEAVRTRSSPVVASPPPHPVHRSVGLIHPTVHVRRRFALAAAARSRGHRSGLDDRIADLDARIADLDSRIADRDSTRSDLALARRRAAETGTDVTALTERVATLRGRLNADRDAGRSTEDTAAALRTAIASLAEAETESLAAEQALATAEREVRTLRDHRERRLALVDERDNLRRRARATLADRVEGAFRRALAAVGERAPDGSSGGGDLGEEGVAIAVARIADVRAPVVLATDRFATPVAARAALNGPVILV
ncbi:MAG: hypothetical protein ABEJ55_03615 [Halanaeroarchaeum sp.]